MRVAIHATHGVSSFYGYSEAEKGNTDRRLYEILLVAFFFGWSYHYFSDYGFPQPLIARYCSHADLGPKIVLVLTVSYSCLRRAEASRLGLLFLCDYTSLHRHRFGDGAPYGGHLFRILFVL